MVELVAWRPARLSRRDSWSVPTRIERESEERMTDLRIEPEEARRLKNALFVDARNPQAWGEAKTTLPGAVRVPANDLQSHLDELPKDRPIITYCT